MSVHDALMGRPGEVKAQALEPLVAHYEAHGWNPDTSSSTLVSFEAPADATQDQITATESGAAAILASYGLGST